ncbi:iron complex outermembrane recepter protein [Bradyrhizobium brasilense]|uniref:Iron complex outermembrane recepter protein n=2 Tax=Bradyrhizobium TaxID=374 RepID=A0A1G6PZF2_9BRAD|nr:iron complex outermembrane recepter protein [Bradyrhizobium brasilense]
MSVDAPQQRAITANAKQVRRPVTARASRANRVARSQQATPQAAARSGAGAGERAGGPVVGFVATRSGTATKTDTPLIEIPQSISVVTTDQIRNQGAESVGAALRYTAGVSGDVNGGSDTRFGGLQIRGFDMTMPGLYLDGLRLPSSNYVHFLGLDPYGAERLEVLKGPSSAMFGGSGTGGILNYVSKLPTAREFGEVSLSGGSFNRYQGEFDIGGRANKEGTVLWRLTGVARDGETQVDYTKDNRVFIAPAVTVKPNEDTTITFLANYQKERTGWGLQFLPPSGTVWANNGRYIPNTRFVGEPGFNQFDTEQSSVGYMLSHDFTEALTFRQNLRYSWMHNEQKSFYGTGYASAADEAAGLLSRGGAGGSSTIDSFAVDNQLQGKFVTGMLSHTTLFGVDYRNTSFRDMASSYSTGKLNVFAPVYTNSWTNNGPYDDTGIKQSQAGLYLQDQIRLGRLSFLLGGRQDFVTTDLDNNLAKTSTSTDASAFTGRAAVMYNFDNGIAPYFSYSESFLPVLSVNAAGELLKPESGVQYEVGVKYQPVGINALITLAAFDLTRSNVVTYAPPFYFAEQTGEVRSRGVELEGTATLVEGVNIRGGYAYVDAEVTKDPVNVGKAPTTVPLNRFSLWGDYTVQGGPLAGVQFGAGVRYVGSTFGDDANTFKVPASTVVDALVAYTRDNYRLSLNVTNLADTRYVAACYGNTSCFYAEGRKAIAKLTYRW